MPATRDARWTVASIARLRRRLAVGAAIVLAFGVVYGIAIWRSSWSPRAVLRGVGDTWPLAFTPDGKTFATSGTNGITLWDTATGRERSMASPRRGLDGRGGIRVRRRHVRRGLPGCGERFLVGGADRYGRRSRHLDLPHETQAHPRGDVSS